MNNNHPFNTVLIGMVCLSLLTGVTFAQQPFEALPKPGEQVPAEITKPTQDKPLIVRPSEDRLPASPFSAPQDRNRAEDQSVVVNTKFAGWEEAGLDIDGIRLSNQLRGSWVMVDPNGWFDGTVVAAQDADVTNMNIFLFNSGRLVKQTRVDSQGKFEFNNVRQGAYSLIGWGPNGFFAFGMNILANNANTDESILSSVNITAFQNKTTINTDWIRYYAPGVKFRVFGRYATAEGRDDPPALFGYQGLETHMPASNPANSISSQPVNTTSDGRLIGRVHQLNSLSGRPVDVRSTKVMLFEGDDVVASATTDNYGVFEFQQVPNGTFGLAAVGVDGVGMITINVGSDSNATDDQGGNGSIIDFTMISPETIGWLNDYASEVAYGRAMRAPRPKNKNQNDDPSVCPECGNQPGGCPSCAAQWQNFCDSRGITFEQWNAQCYRPGVKYGYGNGTIAAAIVRYNRNIIGRSQRLSDRAFYPGEYSGANSSGANSSGQFYYGFGNQQSNPYTPQQQQYMGSQY